jgi:hypothetical protein
MPLPPAERVPLHPPATLKFPEGELDTWVCLGYITDQSVQVGADASPGFPSIRIGFQVHLLVL